MPEREKTRIAVYGASGHAKVVIDAIEKQDDAVIAFLCDDNPALAGRSLLGYPIVTGFEKSLKRIQLEDISSVLVAIGANRVRASLAERILEAGLTLFSVRHPSANIGRDVTWMGGTVLLAGVSVNTDTAIGPNCILNTNCSVDHDCRIAAHVHIAPGATLCGGVSVGESTLIGAGSVVLPGIEIGAGVVVGAGTVVTRNIPDNSSVAGAPARLL